MGSIILETLKNESGLGLKIFWKEDGPGIRYQHPFNIVQGIHKLFSLFRAKNKDRLDSFATDSRDLPGPDRPDTGEFH